MHVGKCSWQKAQHAAAVPITGFFPAGRMVALPQSTPSSTTAEHEGGACSPLPPPPRPFARPGVSTVWMDVGVGVGALNPAAGALAVVTSPSTAKRNIVVSKLSC